MGFSVIDINGIFRLKKKNLFTKGEKESFKKHNNFLKNGIFH